jgi:predicted PhzF superfamily epimerase YddE/YHI9
LHNAFVLPETAHSGNQAAVVLLPPESEADPRTADDRYKAKVARDFNFAETAYVQPLEDGKYSLRWWTPALVSGMREVIFDQALQSNHPY